LNFELGCNKQILLLQKTKEEQNGVVFAIIIVARRWLAS